MRLAARLRRVTRGRRADSSRPPADPDGGRLRTGLRLGDRGAFPGHDENSADGASGSSGVRGHRHAGRRRPGADQGVTVRGRHVGEKIGHSPPKSRPRPRPAARRLARAATTPRDEKLCSGHLLPLSLAGPRPSNLRDYRSHRSRHGAQPFVIHLRSPRPKAAG